MILLNLNLNKIYAELGLECLNDDYLLALVLKYLKCFVVVDKIPLKEKNFLFKNPHFLDLKYLSDYIFTLFDIEYKK